MIRHDVTLTAAREYIGRGWPVFVLGRSKRPVANCRDCPPGRAGHDGDTCRCLTCHGHQAATLNPERVRAMLAAVPYGLLAVRTGAIADLVVVDIDPRNG
ncbi:MAG: bifunctional DNA primase/polymerase, partial [Stackebrandtia sp.]